MRGIATCLLAAGAFAGACAAQGRIDLNGTTCKQFLEMPRDNKVIVVAWLQAYHLDENDEPIVDFDKVQADILRLSERCDTRPELDLMTVAEDLLGK
jgi:hypothetical protein